MAEQMQPTSLGVGAVLHVWRRHVRRLALAWGVCAFMGLAFAQAPMPSAAFGGGPAQRVVGPPARSVAEWLVRLQQASRLPSYAGTFVVSSSAAGVMSSARIWHVCEGDVQIEKVEALSGTPRLTYRRNETVVTFLPEARKVKMDQRESGGAFPNLLATGGDFATADFYSAHEVGQGRVAGFDADIVVFKPLDNLRFGYRIWSEKQTGLAVKVQTLDGRGRVLEQSAFSELQLETPVKGASLLQMMNSTEHYRMEKVDRVKTTPGAEGWALAKPVPGFTSQSCYRRHAAGDAVIQWIFSDGLATVSLFMEPFDAKRHAKEGETALGATHTLMKRIPGYAGAWWVTAVGEVPPQTLRAFADGLVRSP